METLIFATNNENKVTEIRKVLANIFDIITLKEAGIDVDIPEPHDTLEANATEKSRTIFQLTNKNCFSEDTGLEVEALNGEPGVKSARYAGEQRSFDENIDKLLFKLADLQNRKARFRTVISLILNETEHQFEGICNGIIISERKGNNGFGYDPVFVPDGSDKTFAEMNMDEKNNFSHRKKAMKKMIEFLLKKERQETRHKKQVSSTLILFLVFLNLEFYISFMSRIKIEFPENIITSIIIPVRITDINYGNHVGNDAFVSIIHEARLQWLKQNHLSELDITDGAGLIMSDLAIEFKNESFYGDIIEVKLATGEVSRVSFELYYQLSTSRNNQIILLAIAKTGMVCYDYATKKVAAIPEKLKACLIT
ncbi:MAG: RdgB/HAM1 family non-canonical purine NTP pyrophosphatase [Ferruginibacter sp.]